MRFSSKGATDYISLFFLLTILLATIIVIFLTVPGLVEFFTEFFTSILTSIVVIAFGSLLILFGVILAGRHLATGRTIAYIGVAILLVGFFIIEMAYVTKSKEALKVPMTERCSGSYSGGIFASGNAAEFVTCIITGYKYKGDYGAWAFLGFWVFGVVVPILLFISLFQDFVISSGVIKQRRSQKIVGICLGLIAYRGFAVTNLLEILSLGTLGIALLALNLIFLGGLLAYLHRVFERWRPIEAAMEIVRSSAASRKTLIGYVDALQRAIREGDEDAALHLLRKIEQLTTRSDWLGSVRSIRTSILNGDYNNAIQQIQQLRESIRQPT